MQVARVSHRLALCRDCGAEVSTYTEIEVGRKVGIGIRDGQVERITLCTNCTMVLSTQLRQATTGLHRQSIAGFIRQSLEAQA